MAGKSYIIVVKDIEKRAKKIIDELSKEHECVAYAFFVLTTALSMLQTTIAGTKVVKYLEKEEKLNEN